MIGFKKRNKRNKFCYAIGYENINYNNPNLASFTEYYKILLKKVITKLYRRGVRSYYCILNNTFSMLIAEIICEMKDENKDIYLNIEVPYGGYCTNLNIYKRKRLLNICRYADSTIAINNISKNCKENDSMESRIMQSCDVLLVEGCGMERYESLYKSKRAGMKIIGFLI